MANTANMKAAADNAAKESTLQFLNELLQNAETDLTRKIIQKSINDLKIK